LKKDYSPADFPGLEVIYRSETVDYKAEKSEYIKKCVHCGTCYRHYHYIDTEDSAGGAGPVCTHSLSRYALPALRRRLKELGLEPELRELDARYDGIAQSFVQACASGRNIHPNLRRYVIESLVDSLVLEKDWAGFKKLFLSHPDAAFGLAAAEVLMSMERRAARSMLQAHGREFVEIVERLKQRFSSATRKRIEYLLKTAIKR
jgi:hypothetical protein